MPTSAPGNRAAFRAGGRRRAAGFTLIELLIVVALVALTSGLVTLALRDPAANQLEVEAARLAALLESARAESRASGLAARWVPGRSADAAADTPDFRFVGLPRTLQLPGRWLDAEVTAEIVGARTVRLGPEPMIGAQHIVLRLADRRIDLVTDGLGPFTVAANEGEAANPRP